MLELVVVVHAQQFLLQRLCQLQCHSITIW